VGLKVKLGKVLVSEEAVHAGVSVTGTSPSSVVSLKEPQYLSQFRLDEDQKRLSENVRNVPKEMASATAACRQYSLEAVLSVRDRCRDAPNGQKVKTAMEEALAEVKIAMEEALRSAQAMGQAYGCPKCLSKFPKWSDCLRHLRETGHVDTTSMKGIQQMCMIDACENPSPLADDRHDNLRAVTTSTTTALAPLAGGSRDGFRYSPLRARGPDRKDCTPCGGRGAGVRGGHGEKLDFRVGFCSLWEVREVVNQVSVSSGRKVLVPVCVCVCVHACV
jgi:hypothetical protein